MALPSPQAILAFCLAAPCAELLPQGITLTSREGLGWAPCQVLSSGSSTYHLAAGSPALALAPDYSERDLGTGLVVCP